jgi:thiol:disulfide interchange protein
MTRRLLLLIAFVLLSFTAAAQTVATWTATVEPAAAKPGDAVTVKVTAKITAGWHIYSATPMGEGPSATTVTIPAKAPLAKAGKIRQPKPIVKYDENFQINTEYFEKSVSFTLPAKVKADAAGGKQTINLEVEFMGCNDRTCVPPRTVKVPVTITVEGAAAAPAAAGGKSETPSGESVTQAPAPQQGRKADARTNASSGYGDQAEVQRARKEGFWAYIGLAISMGALALLTPCVFPMIPITVSFFTKREAATRGRSMRDALIYSLGIIFTFTGLGILLAVTLGASGINDFAANSLVNAVIAAVFIVFALNLFGLFEIVVPSSVLTKLSSASGSGQGIVSILLMGLTFTLTSFTCTVPFVGTVMVAAASGDIWWSVLGMLAFSAMFSFPFFLLAVFPAWLKSLPKSGGWLNSVKVVMGFLEIAAAMKFLSNIDLKERWAILNRDLFLAFWIGLALMTFLYLLGVFQLSHDTKSDRLGVLRMLFATFFLGIGFYLFAGLNNQPLGELDAFIPPMNYNEIMHAGGGAATTAAVGAPGAVKNGAVKESEVWLSNYQEALARARRENKPLFIDFTGYLCTNCRWMEANVFTRADVQALFKDFILVRLYTDGRGAEYDANRTTQEQRFGTIALPFYVVIDQNDKVIQTFPGMTRKPEDFVSFLKSSLDKLRPA